jgi:hypothetical protein
MPLTVVCIVAPLTIVKYSIMPLLHINWDGKPSGYAENPDIGFFSENMLHWQFEEEKNFNKLLL